MGCGCNSNFSGSPSNVRPNVHYAGNCCEWCDDLSQGRAIGNVPPEGCEDWMCSNPYEYPYCQGKGYGKVTQGTAPLLALPQFGTTEEANFNGNVITKDHYAGNCCEWCTDLYNDRAIGNFPPVGCNDFDCDDCFDLGKDSQMSLAPSKRAEADEFYNFGNQEAQSEQLTKELYNEWLLFKGGGRTCCDGGKCKEGSHCINCGCVPISGGTRPSGQIVYGGGGCIECSAGDDCGSAYSSCQGGCCINKLTNPLGFGGQENIKSGLGSMVPWVVLAVSLGVGLYVSNIVIKKSNN